MSTPVHSPDGRYAAAIAELPSGAHRSRDVPGSLVVLSGRAGWAGRLAAAVDQGARGIVVREPHAADTVELASVLAASPSIPVVVDRPLFRSDLVDDVRRSGAPAPVLVQVECSGSEAEFAEVARDALGWARVLVGGPLELASSRSTSRGFSALLTSTAVDSAPKISVTVLATRRQGTAPWIRALAVGTERTEVTIDVARRSATVERTTEEGRVIHPVRWEAAERVVLRRALDPGVGHAEVTELLLDTRLVASADNADVVG